MKIVDKYIFYSILYSILNSFQYGFFVYLNSIFSGRRLCKYNKDDFYLCFGLFTSCFRISSLEIIKEKLFNGQFLLT